MSDKRIFYFGPIGEAGHYSWVSDYTKSYDIIKENPWSYNIDGRLAPPDNNQKEGEALIHHKGGWTAISFWDRTVDKRLGCSSTYLINGDFTFKEMVVLAEKAFPIRWDAMEFEVTELSQNKADE